MRPDINIFLDEHSGSWVLEALALGKWVRVGNFGSRRAALTRAKAIR